MPDSGQSTTAATYTWTLTGTKTVTITAANCGGVASRVRSIHVQIPASTIYLPALGGGQ
jgi:hypothetical protein